MGTNRTSLGDFIDLFAGICARLMGFPDTFEIPVSDTQAYRQFGNSVVVPVVSFLASYLAERYIAEVVADDSSYKIYQALLPQRPTQYVLSG